MMKKQTYYTFICCLLLSSCGGKLSKPSKSIYFNNYTYFPYDLNKAEKEFFLNNDLREISALTYYDENNLLCINDEQAYVFKYNIVDSEIVDTYNFSKAGDYEGIEFVNGVLYVLRSDSRIFEINNFDNDNIKVQEFKGPLSSKNDTEGLGYDVETNSLLIACKNKASYKGLKLTKQKAVYSFSLDTHKYSSKPKYLLDLENIAQQISLCSTEEISDNVFNRIVSRKDLFVFQPSAIAINPITANIYMLSSVGKMLIVISPENVLLAINVLDKSIIPKPEGICFAPNGDMFISSEGKNQKGTIRQYNYKLK
jgi:uncharacterized protein YjiK